MRMPRRGVIAQRKGGGFIWAIYELAMGIDESVDGTSGSFNLSSSRYKRVAQSYSVSSSGTISLVDSVQTTAANMAIGDYLVNVSTSNNTSTTGTTLYKITAISGTSTRQITYMAYTPTLCAKGTDTGERVENVDGTKYPHDGAQGEYYYVLLRGWTTMYIWDIYKVKETVTSYKSVSTTNQTVSSPSTYSYGTSYDFNTSTGQFTLKNGETGLRYNSSDFNSAYGTGNYWMSGSSSSGTTMYYSGTAGTSSITKVTKYTREAESVSYSKGASTGKTATSMSSNAYPQNGKQDTNWYVYSGTEEIYIDNT